MSFPEKQGRMGESLKLLNCPHWCRSPTPDMGWNVTPEVDLLEKEEWARRKLWLRSWRRESFQLRSICTSLDTKWRRKHELHFVPDSSVRGHGLVSKAVSYMEVASEQRLEFFFCKKLLTIKMSIYSSKMIFWKNSGSQIESRPRNCSIICFLKIKGNMLLFLSCHLQGKLVEPPELY